MINETIETVDNISDHKPMQVFVKEFSPMTSLAVRQAEWRSTRAAAVSGFGPKLYRAKKPDSKQVGALLMQYVSTEPVTDEYIRAAENLNSVIGFIRKLHDYESPKNKFPTNRGPAEQLVIFLTEIAKENKGILVKYRKLAECALEIHKLLATRDNVCVCHNDLQQGNIFQGGDHGYLLIDWKDAGVGNPYIDLGVFADRYNLDSHDILKYYPLHLGETTKQAESQLYLSRLLNRIKMTLFHEVNVLMISATTVSHTTETIANLRGIANYYREKVMHACSGEEYVSAINMLTPLASIDHSLSPHTLLHVNSPKLHGNAIAAYAEYVMQVTRNFEEIINLIPTATAYSRSIASNLSALGMFATGPRISTPETPQVTDMRQAVYQLS